MVIIFSSIYDYFEFIFISHMHVILILEIKCVKQVTRLAISHEQSPLTSRNVKRGVSLPCCDLFYWLDKSLSKKMNLRIIEKKATG
uniref:Putative ovule protein n=1 Tax=Solanum chacoense TaxID=4108 RepID=A0A0V0HFX7_SOLCH